MAKDDFHVIAYRILTYLYQCPKSGKNVDPKQIGVDSDYFKVNGQTINERCWLPLSGTVPDGTGKKCGCCHAARVNR